MRPSPQRAPRASRNSEPSRSRKPIAGGDICRAYRVELADGRSVFVKSLDDPPPDFFAAEADGLAWLAEVGAPVPGVLGHGDDWLAVGWIDTAGWSAAVEDDAGRAVAAMHASGAPAFGHHRDGYVGTVPVDNGPATDWPTFWAERFAMVTDRHGTPWMLGFEGDRAAGSGSAGGST